MSKAKYIAGLVNSSGTILDSTLSSNVALSLSSNAAFDRANTASANAASASLYANTAINNAASASAYANTGVTLAQAAFNAQNSTATIANTAINNSASASLYANTAINNAVSASAYANTGINNAASASTYANTGIALAQAAFNAQNSTATVANTKFNSSGGTISGSVTISSDLNVSGNIFVSGNTTTVSSSNLEVTDPLIYMAQGNPSNLNDIGLVGHFTSDHYQHTGIVRDHTDATWKFFSNVSTEPSSTVNFGEANTVYDSVKVGGLTSTGSVTLSGGTANGLLYLNGSKVATSGSALTFDGTNTLGLNAAGSAIFNVGNTGSYGVIAAGGTNGAAIYFNGATRTSYGSFLQHTATNHIWYNETLGSEWMRLTSTGLGIGTSSPTNKTDIQSSGSYSAAVDMPNAQLRLKHTIFPVQLYLGLDHVNRFAYIQASETGIGYRDIALQPAGGTVGIGLTNTSDYSAKLTVAGNISLTGTQQTPSYIYAGGGADNSTLLIKAGSTAGVYSQIEVTGNWNGTSNIGGKVALFTGGTERMRIDSSGNVGINQTNPTERLEVAGNILVNTSGNPSLTVKTSGSGNNPGINLSTPSNNWGLLGTFSDANAPLKFAYNSSTLTKLLNTGVWSNFYFKCDDVYSATYTTDGTWASAWQVVIPGGTLPAPGGSTYAYLVKLNWVYNASTGSSPYYANAVFLMTVSNCNATNTTSTYTPLFTSSHVPTGYIQVRPHYIAGSTTGLAVNFSGFATQNGFMTVSVARISD